jgi:hypothetical protein
VNFRFAPSLPLILQSQLGGEIVGLSAAGAGEQIAGTKATRDYAGDEVGREGIRCMRVCQRQRLKFRLKQALQKVRVLCRDRDGKKVTHTNLSAMTCPGFRTTQGVRPGGKQAA